MATTADATTQLPATGEPKTVLVIGSNRTNYYQLFAEKFITLDGVRHPIKIEQTGWHLLRATSHSDSGGSIVVTMMPNEQPLPGTPQNSSRTCVPQFVLLRAGTRGGAAIDWRDRLDVFAHSDVPCLNSMDAFMMYVPSPHTECGADIQFSFLCEACV